MGLNDEAEKLRQAEGWLTTDNWTTEQVDAAWNHVVYIYGNTTDPAIRTEAGRIIGNAVTCDHGYWGCGEQDHAEDRPTPC